MSCSALYIRHWTGIVYSLLCLASVVRQGNKWLTGISVATVLGRAVGLIEVCSNERRSDSEETSDGLYAWEVHSVQSVAEAYTGLRCGWLGLDYEKTSNGARQDKRRRQRLKCLQRMEGRSYTMKGWFVGVGVDVNEKSD